MCTAARGVHLFAGNHVTRTHSAVLFLAAFTDADAAPHGERETVFVVWITKVRARIRVVVLRPEAQILVQAIGVDDLPRIRALDALGVTGVITNDPRLFAKLAA